AASAIHPPGSVGTRAASRFSMDSNDSLIASSPFRPAASPATLHPAQPATSPARADTARAPTTASSPSTPPPRRTSAPPRSAGRRPHASVHPAAPAPAASPGPRSHHGPTPRKAAGRFGPPSAPDVFADLRPASGQSPPTG